ncbi:unnamed protein product [Blepharisma stoltei]|uniref:Uncharacterized protein n=1 Tax=Blepharisma stoltei TaxID=1481888 RepID=A0AAU9IL87_9CILI|nr:unnamed protein product [Blepharisma stoltei]
MEAEEKIVSELNRIKEISANLQPRAVYLAGCIRTKTSLSPEVIYTFINKLYDSVKIGVISEENQHKIEIKLYQGKIGEANEMLNALPLKKSTNPKLPSTELIAASPNGNTYQFK